MTGVFLIGTPVVICAKDDFYSFIDGWPGKIVDVQNGLYVIACTNKDGQAVQFHIPGDELREHRN